MLCCGGPYGNLPATEALMAEATRLAIPAGNIICTGDVVAYCAEPAATVARLRQAGVRVLMGNCEGALGLGRADCGCGFAPDGPCDVLAREWFAYAASALDTEAKAWMAALPRRIRFVLGGRRFAVVHGGASDIARFIFASAPDEVFRDEFARLDREAPTDAVVAGHCGLPFSALADGRLWHNPGVIGMPANDGRPEVWYSLLVPISGGIEIRHVPLAYDHEAAARRMNQAGLAHPYAEALGSGLWPDMGVLPAKERSMRGKPPAPGRIIWNRAKAEAA
ncbi:MAG: metallophosphoesterase [Rhodospirillales bacterium]|nr:metallophosphoesterase [Rhodospirillales bacterium]